MGRCLLLNSDQRITYSVLLLPTNSCNIQAEFYGQGLTVANLEPIASSCFFEKYFKYADHTILFVKGGLDLREMKVDGSRVNLCRSMC